MGEISYHFATIDDLQILVDYRIYFMIDFWGEQDTATEQTLRSSLETYYRKAMSEGTHICWFARDGEKVVSIGGMILREQPGNFRVPSGRVGYILNMYTIPGYRRRGISKNILGRLIASGKEAGMDAFELHATQAGEPLYAQNGFHKHSEPTYRMLVAKK